jgi:hypothetical protein
MRGLVAGEIQNLTRDAWSGSRKETKIRGWRNGRLLGDSCCKASRQLLRMESLVLRWGLPSHFTSTPLISMWFNEAEHLGVRVLQIISRQMSQTPPILGSFNAVSLCKIKKD